MIGGCMYIYVQSLLLWLDPKDWPVAMTDNLSNVTERSKAPDLELRSEVVGSIPSSPCQQFFNPGLQKKSTIDPNQDK